MYMNISRALAAVCNCFVINYTDSVIGLKNMCETNLKVYSYSCMSLLFYVIYQYIFCNYQSGTLPITDDELKIFSETAISKDSTNASLLVVVRAQGQTWASSDDDEAPLPLLDVEPSVKDVSTVARLIALYDNYDPYTTHSEVITTSERKEESDLLDAILDTPIWTYTNDFLTSKGYVQGSKNELKELLSKIWFTVYSRGKGILGSSAFEHIFVGEIKRGKVSGMHNWLYFNYEEQNSRVNYLGYLKLLDFNGKGGIIKLHYTWNGYSKPVGSMFVGTSPELELALYTVCYFARANGKCYLKINDKKFYIKMYTFNFENQELIGSAFPIII